jgi:energy coupling factor transporter S component ThiW
MRTHIHKLVLMAVLVAIGTATAGTLWFPAGLAKAYPVQHAINVLAGVFLGPANAATVAFVIALLRNLLGLGTLMAFPGSMVGALLAGLAYRWSRGKLAAALAGEVFGTGVLGALLSVSIVRYLLGQEATAFFFIPPFIISSGAGAVLGGSLALALTRVGIVAGIQEPKR